MAGPRAAGDGCSACLSVLPCLGPRSQRHQAALLAVTLILAILALQRTPYERRRSPALSHTSARAAPPRACGQDPMALAIYQGRWYHSEVFGVWVDHARECGHSLTIYYDPSHATSAVALYEQLYPDRFTVKPPSEFLADESRYDAVVFTTPDDIPDELLQKRNAHRFIYTVHLLEPAYAKDWQLLRIHMSTIVSWPFVVPMYDGGAPPPAAGRTREIMMIGTLWDGTNYDIGEVYKLAALLKPHGWTLVCYSRHWGTDQAPPENMRLELSKSTVEAYEAARRVSFIIVWPAKGSWYLVDRLTGSLPFAMSVGTPLLTSSAFASVYNLHEGRGCLVSEDVTGIVEELVGVHDGSIEGHSKGEKKMSVERHQALIDTTFGYRELVRAQNTKTLDSLLASIPGPSQRGPLAMPNPLTRFYLGGSNNIKV